MNGGVCSLVLSFAAGLCLAAYYPASAADFHQVNNGAIVDITEHSVCKRIINNHGSGLAIFVPSKTATEWSAFYNATIPGVTVSACPPPCGGTYYGGYCWYYGAVSKSCTTTCSSHGGTTNGTINYVGSGGSLTNCINVATALGISYGSASDDNTTNNAQGCHSPSSYPSTNIRRNTKLTTTQAAGEGVIGVRRVCSCAN